MGTRNLYLLAPGGLAVAQQWLTRTWDTVLAAYAADVSQAARSSSAGHREQKEHREQQA